jgi:hypothetical protein
MAAKDFSDVDDNISPCFVGGRDGYSPDGWRIVDSLFWEESESYASETFLVLTISLNIAPAIIN